MVTNVGALEQVFKLNKEKDWVFIAPGGNQGDSMIYQGAYKLADKVGLNYRKQRMGRKAPPPKIRHDEVIYVHGGGGWNTWWNWTPRMVRAITDKYSNNFLVIGPSTVAPQKWYIKKWLPPEKTVFIARELTSYKYMKNNGLQLFLDDDTAFHLEKGDKYLTPLLKGDKIKPFKLAAIREDPESPDTLPESVDLEKYDIVVDPCQTKRWGPLHLYATEILTNRSHSAILGAILGKKTKMFKGKYHKNRSIWEFSLKKMGVEWVT